MAEHNTTKRGSAKRTHRNDGICASLISFCNAFTLWLISFLSHVTYFVVALYMFVFIDRLRFSHPPTDGDRITTITTIKRVLASNV